MRKLPPVLGLTFAALTAMLAFGCGPGPGIFGHGPFPELPPCERQNFGSLFLINSIDEPARVLIRDGSGTTVAEPVVGNGAGITMIQLQPGSYSLTAFWPLVPKTSDHNFSIEQCGIDTLII